MKEKYELWPMMLLAALRGAVAEEQKVLTLAQLERFKTYLNELVMSGGILQLIEDGTIGISYRDGDFQFHAVEHSRLPGIVRVETEEGWTELEVPKPG